jgi:hypothetical protein
MAELDGDRWGHEAHDYAFDISNNDYLTALAAGGCCCVPTPEKTIPALWRKTDVPG